MNPGGVVCFVICLSRAASLNVLSSIGPMHLFSDSVMPALKRTGVSTVC